MFSADSELCFLSQQMLELLRLLALKSLLLWKFKAVLAVGCNRSLSQHRYDLSLYLSMGSETETIKLGRGSQVAAGSWNICWCQWHRANTCAVAKPWLRQRRRAELAVLPLLLWTRWGGTARTGNKP